MFNFNGEADGFGLNIKTNITGSLSIEYLHLPETRTGSSEIKANAFLFRYRTAFEVI